MDARISLHEKCPKYGVFSGPYFPVFGLKAEISETSSTEVLAKTALHRFFNKKLFCKVWKIQRKTFAVKVTSKLALQDVISKFSNPV